MKLRSIVVVVCGVLIGCDSGAETGAEDTSAADTSVADSASGDSAAPDTNVAPDTAVEDDTAVTPDSAVEPDTSVPADTTPQVGPKLTYGIEKFTVDPGKERQVCRTVNIPSDKPFDIVRFETTMLGISHHFNLYKVIDDTALLPVSEEENAVHDCSPAAEQLRGDAAYIFGSATPDRVMETPPGVAFHLQAGQRLIVEYHAINYTPETIEASLQIDLIGAAPDAVIEHHADIMWFANWGFFLPAGKETTDSASCSVPYDVEVFGLMSHFHELGTHFVVETLRDGQAEQVYEDDDWQHPLYQPFSPTLSLAQGESLRWTCTWNNTRGSLVMPNKGSKDEMCMVFGAAYPKNSLSAEPISCNVLF